MRFSIARLAFPVLTTLAVLAGSPVHPQSVAIRGMEEGQGVLRPRGETECYVIAPGHVVHNAPPPIAITGVRGERATAELRQNYPGVDLSILELSTSRGFECSEWNIPKDLQTMLANPSVEAVLRTQEEDGSISFFQVSVRNVAADYVSILSTSPEDRITQGMSGSQLLVQGRFAGMLLSVDGSRGTGRVIRSDAIDRHVGSFFVRAGTGEVTSAGPDLTEPNLWLRTNQGTIIGDRNTPFGIQFWVDPTWRNPGVTVLLNGVRHTMTPGTRLSYPDSRRDCYITYLRTEDPTPALPRNNDERHGFRLFCDER